MKWYFGRLSFYNHCKEGIIFDLLDIYGPLVVTLLNWICIFEWYMCKSDKKTHSNLFCLKPDMQKRCDLAKKGVEL